MPRPISFRPIHRRIRIHILINIRARIHRIMLTPTPLATDRLHSLSLRTTNPTHSNEDGHRAAAQEAPPSAHPARTALGAADPHPLHDASLTASANATAIVNETETETVPTTACRASGRSTTASARRACASRTAATRTDVHLRARAGWNVLTEHSIPANAMIAIGGLGTWTGSAVMTGRE